MKALFVTVDAGGNLPPALGVAAALRERGASVAFLGHEALRGSIERAGFPFEAFRTAGDYDPRRHLGNLRGLAAFLRLAADRGIGADAVASAGRLDADVVVADCLVSGGIERIVAAGLPVVSLVHTFDAYFAAMPRGPIGALLRLRGVDLRRVQASVAARVVTVRRDLDPVRDVPPRTRHVGVVRQGVPVAASPAAVPRVLVSLSTIAFPGQDRTLQRILDALGTLPVSAVVTTGPTLDPLEFRVPPNAEVHAWLDHASVLPTASLVIGHGGHSTTARALSYGVPVLVVPSHPLLDQPLVGRAVTAAGVGGTLPRRSSPARFAATVQSLLADEAVRGAAAAMGADIRAHDGAVVAAAVIEEVANGRPIPATA